MEMNVREFEAALSDADLRLKRLRSLYDQWFSGIERFEPQQDRTQFETLLTRMRQQMPRNTAVRFRLQQLNQRYTTYSAYWARVSRQIEEGTYHRDVMRARRQREKREQQEASPSQRGPVELDTNIDVQAALADADAAARKMPARPAAGASRPARAAGAAARGGAGGDISDAAIQQVYQRYVAARAKNAERTDNVKVETIAKTLRKMMPKLRAKHGDRRIDFDVVVKDGRVALRPKAR